MTKELHTKKPLLIKNVIYEGNLDLSDATTSDHVLHAAANALDKCCSHDITGTVLFLGDDDVWYIGAVEFEIVPANKSYILGELSTC